MGEASAQQEEIRACFQEWRCTPEAGSLRVRTSPASVGDAWRIRGVEMEEKDSRCKMCWDLAEVSFTLKDDGRSPRKPRASVISSGSVEVRGYEPSKAFDASITSLWGGRPDSTDSVWIGQEFDRPVEVCTLKIIQAKKNRVASVAL